MKISIIILILFYSCDDGKVPSTNRDSLKFINTQSIEWDIKKDSTGMQVRAAAPAVGGITDVIFEKTPDATVTRTKSGSTLKFSIDVSSTNLGIPVILAELKRKADSIKAAYVLINSLKTELAKKDTIFFKGMKGTGTKLNPYEDIEP